MAIPVAIPVAIMTRPFYRIFLPFACVALSCVSVPAQTNQPITVRMVDSRTGLLIPSNSFLVRMNHLEAAHGDWVRKNEDGTGNLTLPADATVISIHATYESATQVYVNCDTNKDRGSSDHAANPDRWYEVAAILTSGVVAPNDCVGKKVPEKLQVVAKPGEFVFFVRPMNSLERFKE
jgi:hypothetical protein